MNVMNVFGNNGSPDVRRLKKQLAGAELSGHVVARHASHAVPLKRGRGP